jgi:hypothetical protein
MFTFFFLLCVAAFAKMEQIFVPNSLTTQKTFLRNYKFVDPNSWFCKLCKSIPTECPAKKIGLPPMCKMNPLYDECVFLKMKADDVGHQDDVITLATAMQ